jgi:glucokinase
VFIENDANVAAIAEATHGAGRDYKDFLFVIWGTGVGGGIILNHKIFRGPQGGAGEIGHITIDYNGPACNCGSRGCIESYIGQRYLSHRTAELLRNLSPGATPSRIVSLVEGNLSKIDPYIISKAAEDGDATARTVLEEAGELLGYALASALNVLDLRVVIVGGGISAAPQFVFKAIESALHSRVLRTHKSSVRVLKAALGNDAGIIGAANLLF